MAVIRRVFTVVCCSVIALASPAYAHPYPHTIALPVDWGSEGIAAAGNTFYAGSLIDGDIYRGSLRTGSGAVLVDVAGRQAAGLKVDTAHHLLFVAGGGTGHAYVYNSRTGAEVADLAVRGAAFLNDVVVTPTAAYFTETFGPRLYRVPIGSDGSIGAVETITVTGPAAAATDGFGLNGIDTTPDGTGLIVDHTAFGALFRIDPTTGASTAISLPAGSLVPGTLDGILRAGRDVWVAENFANTLVRVHLSTDGASGTVTQTLTDPAFEIPTTIARHGERLAVVNAKFDLGLPPPFGSGAPAGTPFEVVVVHTR